MAIELTGEAAAYLKKRGFAVIGDAETAHACRDHVASATDSELGRKTDLMLVLGGDGTFIRASSVIGDRRIPILGVNMGSLGFLTEITAEEIWSSIDSFLSGDYRVTERMRLRVTVTHGDKTIIEQDVINELAIVKSALSPMISVDVSADGNFVSRFRGDGLILATPTGSTAYNLAIDGPIVYPTARCMVLTPIAPHMLADRPLVLPDETRLSVMVSGVRGQTFINLDGLRGMELGAGDEIQVAASPNPLIVVVSRTRDYFSILRAKLKWGAQ
jgi:NAD+ kinase